MVEMDDKYFADEWFDLQHSLEHVTTPQMAWRQMTQS